MSNSVITVKNLTKTFYSSKRSLTLSDIVNFRRRVRNQKTFKVLDGINFEVQKGEFFGIMGRNGSGKSTLLKILLGNMKADKGSDIKIQGSIMRLAMGIGFNQTLTARDNIYINASLLGLSFKEIGEKFHHILEFAEVEDFVDTQIKNYSSGMRARLMFAIALHAKSEILLLDEMFGGVGDAGFKEKSSEAFKNLLSTGRTIVMVSHNPKTISMNCSRVLVLDKGKQIALTNAEEGVEIYRDVFRKNRKKSSAYPDVVQQQ